MVHLPVFGEGVSVPFPRFGFEKKEGRAAEKLVMSAEAGAHEILSEMSNKEYLARRALASTMPRLNRVLKSLGSTTRNMMFLRRCTNPLWTKRRRQPPRT
jgi:hypothetical protein